MSSRVILPNVVSIKELLLCVHHLLQLVLLRLKEVIHGNLRVLKLFRGPIHLFTPQTLFKREKECQLGEVDPKTAQVVIQALS